MSPLIAELHVLIAILKSEGGAIALPRNGWTLSAIASLLSDEHRAVSAVALASAIREEIGVGLSLPSTVRIDRVLDGLRQNALTPPGGWSVASIAAIAGCSVKSVDARLAMAIKAARAIATRLNLTGR